MQGPQLPSALYEATFYESSSSVGQSGKPCLATGTGLNAWPKRLKQDRKPPAMRARLHCRGWLARWGMSRPLRFQGCGWSSSGPKRS